MIYPFADVELKLVSSAEEFITAWNESDDEYYLSFILAHGSESRAAICFDDKTVLEADDTIYCGFSGLKQKRMKKAVALISCYGSKAREGKNVAQCFANLTQGRVVAAAGIITFDRSTGRLRPIGCDWEVITPQ